MSKFIKVVKIVAISLLIIGGIAAVIFYLIDPVLAKYYLDIAIDYANRPLPIVGVSSLVVAALVWKIFQATYLGKKNIAKIKIEYEKEKADIVAENEKRKIEYTAIITSYENEIDLIYDAVMEMCEASANKKVKAVGERLKNDIESNKQSLRERFNNIVDSNVELLIKNKEEIINTILNIIKVELEKKYGEEGKKAIESIAEAAAI